MKSAWTHVKCMVCRAVVYDALVACTCMCTCASLHWQTALCVLVSYTEISSTRQAATGMDHIPGMCSYNNEHRACQHHSQQAGVGQETSLDMRMFSQLYSASAVTICDKQKHASTQVDTKVTPPTLSKWQSRPKLLNYSDCIMDQHVTHMLPPPPLPSTHQFLSYHKQRPVPPSLLTKDTPS